MLRFRVTERPAVTTYGAIFINMGSIAAALGAIGLVFLFSGINPFYAVAQIFLGSFGSIYGIMETVTKAIPLILIGGGLTLAFRARFWNIGAEGQLLMGALMGTWVGLTWGETLPAFILIPVMFAAGFMGGAMCGIIPAILKVKFSINEVISTLMFNYICAQFVTMLIVGPWKGGSRFGFPGTDNLPDAALLGLIPGSRIHVFTLILALVSVILLYIIIHRTRFGYDVRVIGENPDAARYAGINFFRTSLAIMAVSGGLAGFAGVGEVAGIHHYLGYPASVSSGYGFTAIIVAWLAKLNPLLSIVSAIFFAGIMVGGDAIQITLGLPAATVQIVNGILLVFLITGDYFIKNRVTLVWGKPLQQ
ncbi:MAG: ABC transporter permease [Desulfamplus sp.]|nr:ABC transporter permease [Desulfamplus sp.]